MAAPGTAASGTTAALSPAPPGLAPRPGALHPSPRVTRPPRTIGPSVWRRCAGWPWALPVVLCVQAVLSLRLIRVNTAFQDEALYLWAGHMEWSHWLHGTSIPLYATYFSGAPVLYPPLGALADSLGGLVGARLLSLGFMLVATAALWGTTSRLYGRRAAFFAAALWAVLGPTLHLGVFATYDAMSLCLLAVAAWCAVHAGPRRDETGWMAATAAALVLANATKYASALFDPVVVAIVILNAWSLPAGSKAALSRGAALAAYVTSGAILLVTVGGGYYEAGIGQTTLTRTSGTDSPMLILGDSWSWSMTVVIAALVGAAVALVDREVPAPEAGAGGAGRRSVAGAGRAGPYPHPDLAGQARGLRGLVRRHRRGLRRQQADRSMAAPVAARRGHGGDRRRPRGAGPAGSRAGALAGAAVAQRDPVLPRLRPAGGGPSRALPGRDAVHSRVLPAARGALAVVVEYPQRGAAQRAQHQRGREQAGKPLGLRPFHRPGLLQPGRAGLLRDTGS